MFLLGFLDSTIQTGINLVSQVPLVGDLAASPIQQATNIVGLTSPLDSGGGGGGGLLATIGQVASLPTNVLQDVLGTIGGNGKVNMTGFGGGNGRTATRTIVQTMDLATGKIIREKFMEGSPHIMNKDVTAANRLFKQTRKLDRRLPRKTVRESKTKQLADAAIDKALRDTNSSSDCK